MQNGHSWANKLARISLEALGESLGPNGLNAVLNFAGLPHLIGKLPPDNLERGFDTADFTALMIGLEEMYGARGGRALAYRAGQAAFPRALKTFGAQAGVADLAERDLSPLARLRICLPAAARVLNQLGDQQCTVMEQERHFTITVRGCPACVDRVGLDQPACSMLAGALAQCASWLAGGQEWPVIETGCCAMGDEVCTYHVPKSHS